MIQGIGLRRFALLLVTLPVAAIVGLLVIYAGGVGGEISAFRVILAAVLAALVVGLPLIMGARRGLLGAALISALAIGWWASLKPSLDREWAEPAARTPWATIEGDVVTIYDVRDFRYDVEREGEWEARWYDETYDLTRIEQAYFILTTFGVRGVGHVMVSFRFRADQGEDQYIVLSVEIRREEGESYDPIGGIFRQYELFYTAADERDALALRTHVHQDPTWVIPINAGREKTGEFFLDMVERMTALHESPEWYNSLTNSCATNLASHYEAINEISLPPDYRILLPGFSDELINELGLFAEGVDAAQARQLYRVDEVASLIDVDDDYSRQIRRDAEDPR